MATNMDEQKMVEQLKKDVKALQEHKIRVEQELESLKNASSEIFKLVNEQEGRVVTLIGELRDRMEENHSLFIRRFDEITINKAREQGREEGALDERKRIYKTVGYYVGLVSLAIGFLGVARFFGG